MSLPKYSMDDLRRLLHDARIMETHLFPASFHENLEDDDEKGVVAGAGSRVFVEVVCLDLAEDREGKPREYDGDQYLAMAVMVREEWGPGGDWSDVKREEWIPNWNGYGEWFTSDVEPEYCDFEELGFHAREPIPVSGSGGLFPVEVEDCGDRLEVARGYEPTMFHGDLNVDTEEVATVWREDGGFSLVWEDRFGDVCVCLDADALIREFVEANCVALTFEGAELMRAWCGKVTAESGQKVA